MSEPTNRYRRRHTAFGDAVAARARMLQVRSLRVPKDPTAVAALARLRRAIRFAPGADPDVWDDTIGLIPDSYIGTSEEPNPWERAAHHTMTLFALHRQGSMEEAQIDGRTPGATFGVLARKRANGESDSEGVRRRFDAMVTATTPEESAYHLRGLVLLMKSDKIGLDYGLLADDLVQLWSPRSRDMVRLRWARQYRQRPRTDNAPSPANDSTTTIAAEPDSEESA